jgi:ubiquitin carboxyl-terminal hydrolase L3
MEDENQDSNWKPLESNPEVINEYVNTLGFNSETFNFQDMLSIEDWGQEMVAQPCLGLMLIFPITEISEKHRAEEKAKITADGQHVDPDLFYMHQYAKNACGTVGVFHILGNLPEDKKNLIAEDSMLSKFYKACEGKTYKERGNFFRGSKTLKESHE